MPQTINFPAADEGKGGGSYPVATEDELLEFANKIRLAGGADVLEALLPSEPQDSMSCLIAKALNFSCEVTTVGKPLFDGEYRYKWVMILPYYITDDERTKIANDVGVELIKGDLGDRGLELPAHIGNAADAFDVGLAFREFIDPDSDIQFGNNG